MDNVNTSQNRLVARIEKALNQKVDVKITKNKTSLISAKKKNDCYSTIRIHQIFLKADDTIIEEIINFLKNPSKKSLLLKSFIHQNSHLITPKRAILNPLGKFYNLSEIFCKINKIYFNNTIKSGITWSSKTKRHTVKKRIMGCYDNFTDTIRINAILDDLKTPLYYIEFVVFHEMLHAFLGKKNGRWHSKEFREQEKTFLHYEEALLWEKSQRF